MKALLFVVLMGMMSVCFADAGEVNEREFICAKIGQIARTTIQAKEKGHTLEELQAHIEQHYGEETPFKQDMKDMVTAVFQSTEDKTPAAAYATQYTRCLTGETFKGVEKQLQ